MQNKFFLETRRGFMYMDSCVHKITGITVTEKRSECLRAAAGTTGKAASDSRLLPRVLYEWLCIIPTIWSMFLIVSAPSQYHFLPSSDLQSNNSEFFFIFLLFGIFCSWVKKWGLTTSCFVFERFIMIKPAYDAIHCSDGAV